MPSSPSPEEGRGVYVHVPFCVHRCGYCDFVTYAGRDEARNPYVEALLAEAARRGGGRLETAFFGGGTPTHLGAARLARLVEGVLGCFDVAPDAEVTCEANPESFTPEVADALVAAGVGRVSLGVQSLVDAELEVMERAHDAAGAARAVEVARRAGIPRISLDLIYGLPGQDLASFRRSLEGALALEPGHLSLYALSLEPGAPWTRERPMHVGWEPDDDLQAEMMDLALARLRRAGFEAYEISNFARPGEESRHNLRYWRSQPVLGLGVGAWGLEAGVRTRNAASLEAYLEDQRASRGPFEVEHLDPEARRREAVVMRLRLAEGVARDQLGEGPEGAELAAALDRHVSHGLVEIGESGGTRVYKLTDRGRMLANTVMADIL